MDAKLQIVSGKTSQDIIALTLPVIIGRGKDAGLTIAHPLISRQHCRLYEADGLLMLQDLESTNGTFLDGRRIREAPLPPEAEFSIGPLSFRALYDYVGDPSALPAPVFADQAGEPSTEVTPELEVLDEDVDFLLADDVETAPEPSLDSAAAPGAGSPQTSSEAETPPQDLLETTSLPSAKDVSRSPKVPDPAKSSDPNSQQSSAAQPSSDPPLDEISDEEFEKFFDDI